MATPGESVYRGLEGTGEAQVYGPTRDPLSLYMGNQQRLAGNELRRQQLGLARKKQQEGEIGKVLGFKYEDPGERFRIWGQDTINKTNQSVMGLFQGNPDADVSQLRPYIMDLQGQAQKDLNAAKELNNVYNEKIQTVGADKYVDKAAFNQLMSKTIGKDSPYEVDREKLDNIEKYPMIYNLPSMVGDTLSKIEDQYRNTSISDIQKSPLGLFVEVTDNKIRFKDPEATMDFVLRGDDVTDLGVSQKISGGQIDDTIRSMIAQKEVQKAGGDPNDEDQVMKRFQEIQYDPSYAGQVRQILRPFVDQLNQKERSTRIQSMGKFPTDGGSKKITDDDYKDRQVTLENIRKGDSESIGRLTGKFGNLNVTGASYQKGGTTYPPEHMAKIQELTRKSIMGEGDQTANMKEFSRLINPKFKTVRLPDDKIILNLKTGTMYGTILSEAIPMDLNDPSTEPVLHAILNTSPSEKKIPIPDYKKWQRTGKATGFSDEESVDIGFTDVDEE